MIKKIYTVSSITIPFIFKVISRSSYIKSQKPIVVYGTSFCGPCSMAKKYLTK